MTSPRIRPALVSIFATLAIFLPPGHQLLAAEPAAADTPLVSEKVRQLMQDRNYAEAIPAIAEAAKAPNQSAPREYLGYLKCRALYLAGKYDEAIAAFDQLQQDFPKSPWIRHARFGKAVALARKGDFRAAELIYRAEAEYLLSIGRKQQIADIYLEYASSNFKPPKEDQKPDYQKALDFYKKALEVGPKPEKRVEVELLVAECLQKLGRHGEAAALYEQFAKDHPTSLLDIEARYRLGECRLAEGNLKEARRVWEDLLAKYPESQSERIADARFNLARTWRIPNPQSEEELNLGTGALDAFIERFPKHKLASQAHLEIAQSFMHRGRYEDAVKALKRFLADPRYQDRTEIPDARNLLGLSYQLQKKFPEALATWREFLAKHPAHKAWSNVQRQIIDTEYLAAAEKLALKQYVAANQLFADFLAKYPLDPRNPNILLLMNSKNVQEEKWDDAIAAWRRIVSKYPGTDEASRAQFAIADTLERKLGKLEEALEQYRKVTGGSATGQARVAIARLTAKTMTVSTERVFRSDETPRLKLLTRNIESVTVRAYKVDLETYFRKMHLARGVEGLDIALIDPDKTMEFKVPKYAKHQELESAVEVPLPGGLRSGVMAVTVSSKTLETTTLVLQSDLDVIVKSSRDEVFVFAENMLTGKPWADVKLLVSNGKEVFAEGTTGKDGVFQKTYGEILGDRSQNRAVTTSPSPRPSPGGRGGHFDAGDVRVFAVAAGNVASNLVNLRGVGVAQGLNDKGYIYTDRPAYRPGQLVNVRGVLRHAADDAYMVEKDKKYTVEVFDSRNRLVRQEQVKLGGFGSFHLHFILPPTSPQGQYRVLVRDNAGQNYQGAFQVHEFQLEPIRLVVDTPRRVYYRGEDIEGKIRAEFYYGAPLVGREVRYRLADDRLQTATTDAKGEIRFKLPTREYSETQVLPLLIQLPERGMQTAVNFVLAARGFAIGVSTVRPVYVAGETFEAKVETRDAEGKPIAQKLALKVLEQTTVEGRVGERLVEEFPVETLAADGLARKTVKLGKGGRFILRAEGTDRFKNPITGQAMVQISDEEDAVRLRILADKHTFKVGDTAGVKLHWREQPALALVTFQGARVLDYRLVELKPGENALEIPMTARLAPNFELSVAVMTDPRPDKASGEEKGGDGKKTDDKQVPLSLRERAGVRGSSEKAGGAQVPLSLRERAGVRGTGDNMEPSRATPKSEPSAARPHPNPPGTAKWSVGEGAGQRTAHDGDKKKPILRFHAATSPFIVERDLRVKIAAKPKGDGKGPARPGDELEVTITTTDPQGKPVAAEVGLAMVEQSLLERFARPVPPIQDFFRGQFRQAAVRTTASITFAYSPRTSPINPRLLAEQDRQELLREEEESRRAAIAVASRAAGFEEAMAHVDQAQVPTANDEDINGDLVDAQNNADGVIRGYQTMGRRFNFNRIAGPGDQLPGQQVMSEEIGVNSDLGVIANDPFSRSGSGRLVLNGANTYTGATNIAGGTLVLDGNNTYTGITNFNPAVQNPNGGWNYTLNLGGGNTYGGGNTINAGDLNTLVSQNQGQIAVVDNRGNYRNLKLSENGRWDQRRAETLAAELTQSGAILLSAMLPQETGYWNPAVTTGENGKATVTFTMPERSTAWKLLAKGVTAETLAGEATDDLTVKKDLFGELKLPLAFTDGDEAEIQVAVHNDVLEKGRIEVVLKTKIAGRSIEEKKTLDVTAKGIHEVAFKTAFARPRAEGDGASSPEVNVEFELTVKAAERQDVVRAAVPLQPYGMPVFATASGSASSDTTAWVEPPKDMPLESPGMQILVGPSVQRSLLDIVLGPAPWCQIEAGRIASGMDSGTSDLMASLGLQKLLAGSRQSGSPEAQALEGRVRASISLLASSQNDDGGWSWTGWRGASNRYASSRNAWALSLARKAGYNVPEDSFNKALGYLRNQVAATDNSDYESKAILLHALSVAGQGDFALANRLYRDRPMLSPAALAHLALALAAMDRKSTAEELLTLLGERNLDDRASRLTSATGSLPWSHSPTELRALYALALQEVGVKTPKTKELVDWLLAHRTGHRWAPDKATGPAALALCRWLADTRFEGEHYKLAVFVNDVRVKVLDIAKDSGSELIEVPGKLLAKGKQRVNFQITGRGQYTYQCILGGFAPADKLKASREDWRVERHYEPAPLELDGREIPRGFGVLSGNYTTFRNPLGQLPVGRRGIVELNVWRTQVSSETPEERLEYLVITEPIPSGTTVIEKSVQGAFERFEIAPGQITFYVGNRRWIGTIRYELYGYLPGKYRTAPTVMRDAHRPGQFAISTPKLLEILPLGSKSSDPYRLTPQELLELGKRHFEKKDYKAAQNYLTELVEKWNLHADPYKSAVQMLLDIHLENGPPAKVVHYFEIIKEKWPAEEIPFAKIVKVGAAYHEMGEYERSYLVFRATVESSFNRESEVAGFLQAQGEFARSVDVMGRLLREYPPEPYIAAATYALAQQVYAKAPEAAADARLRQQKINRVDLVRRAWTMLEGFLTASPDDPAADQAAFATANALLEMKAYREAAEACNRYAKRYAASDLLDSYWYMIGYCEFATGKHQAALEMCRKVAEAKRTDKATGRELESPNKWRAVYILGQIYHSLGKAAEAIGEYRRVEDRFADAKEAISYFLRKAIELPEVTSVKPGGAAEVELKFRNIAACDIKVYRIDLMKFSLLKRNLGGIAQINLAGIRPLHEDTAKLGDGKDYRDRTQKLPLPLKEEGAYLVVCRGDDLHASGLVLVTPLAVEVQEDAVSGRVRATIKQSAAAERAEPKAQPEDRYVSNVHVKVIGSRNEDFVAGSTDLRGIFVADGIRGRSTVIARAEGSRYAFFRGLTELVPAAPNAPAASLSPAAASPAGGKPGLERQLLEQLQEQNKDFQRGQLENLKKMYSEPKKGVEAKAAF